MNSQEYTKLMQKTCKDFILGKKGLCQRAFKQKGNIKNNEYGLYFCNYFYDDKTGEGTEMKNDHFVCELSVDYLKAAKNFIKYVKQTLTKHEVI